MMLRSVLVLLTCSCLLAHEGHQRTPFTAVKDDPSLPRVLLLGDSISIGYTMAVQDQLAGVANVHRAPENCGPTNNGLAKLDSWLGDRTWDVIHFNFGLHDLKYIDKKGKRVPPAEGQIQVPLAQYKRNLSRIIQRLRKSRAKLIWCATTPVPEGAHGRIPKSETEYNQAALEVIGQQSNQQDSILINDLCTFANERIGTIQRPADVHFTKDGSKELATQVVAAIKQGLELKSSEPQTAQGAVFHDSNGNGKFDSFEKPLANIKVSNGQQISTTDANGRYELPISNDSIIFLLKPRNWQTPLDENKLPRFFYIHKPAGSPPTRYPGVDPTGPLPVSIDFPLYKQREPNAFKAILFGDPQPSNQQEVDYIAHDIVEELIGTDASFGVTLGDIVNNDLSLFKPQARAIAMLGIPWYNVIGNHDLNFDAPNDQLSDETFEREFGPAYYSFDYGPVHFLVLDDVEWFVQDNGKGTYRGGLGKTQMAFIRNDLSKIPERQLVVLLMHIPLTDVHDRKELYSLIQKRPFSMSVSAHRHIHEHRFITKEDGWQGPEPHHHVINVTVSGSWWQGQKDERGIPHTLMADGAPNGYSIISFDGHQYKLDFRAAGRSKNYQMNIYLPERIEFDQVANTKVMVNVFNGSPRSKVEYCWNHSRDWTRLDRELTKDPAFVKVQQTDNAIRETLLANGKSNSEVFKKLTGPATSTHIWSGQLTAVAKRGVHVLHVRTTDMHGRIFHGRKSVRVE